MISMDLSGDGVYVWRRRRNVKRENLTSVYALLVASMALWGGTWVAGRILAQSMSPTPAAFLRFLVASAVLVAMSYWAQGRLPRLRREDVLPAMFLGATGVFAYSYFFFTGLQTISAGRAALVVACVPVAICIASAVVNRERFGPLRAAGALISLVGVSLVIGDGDPLALLTGGMQYGDLMILGCVVSWTAYSLGGRALMQRLNPLTAVTWSCIFGALFLLPPALMDGLFAEAAQARAIDWACIVYLGSMATALAFFWYYRAISIIGASRSGIFVNMVPVFAVIMGFFVLGEPLHLSLLAGGALVVTGVYLTNRP